MNRIEGVRNRFCKYCETSKPETRFNFPTYVNGTFYSQCTLCRNKMKREKTKRKSNPCDLSHAGESFCTACATWLDLTKFHSKSVNKLGEKKYASRCRDCLRIAYYAKQKRVPVLDPITPPIPAPEPLTQEQRETAQELARWEESAARARAKREADQEADEQAYETKKKARKTYKAGLLEAKWDEWAEQAQKARKVPRAANACLCCHSRHAGEGCYCARCKEMGKGEKK